MNTKNKYLLKLFVLSLIFLIFTNKVSAQELNISVTPPITEVLIVPGKEIVQSYKITNDSDSKLISVNIVPFLPDIKNPEEIILNEKEGLVESDVYKNWFSIENPEVNFGEKFNLPSNSEQEIKVKISVPKNATLKDYYFTILFSIEKLNTIISENSLQTVAQIGSNILITASEKENPYKAAKTILFSSPFIVDSLQNIKLKVIIENTGKTFTKPTGKITIENLLTKNTETLSLSPLNILSSYSREIYCLDKEEIIPCKSSPKILLGLYKSTLNYNLDEEGKNYQEITYTFAFPFSLIISILIILIIYKTIVSRTKNKD